jgi:branched-chain amino acid aminotransferase
MEIAADLGYTVKETDITRGTLYLADEVFFTGTAAEITPVREIDGRTIGKPGPITQKIQTKFFEAAKGKDKKYQKWLDYV